MPSAQGPLHAPLKQRGAYHTVGVSVPLVTHTGAGMRPRGGFIFHLFSKNLGS